MTGYPISVKLEREGKPPLAPLPPPPIAQKPVFGRGGGSGTGGGFVKGDKSLAESAPPPRPSSKKKQLMKVFYSQLIACRSAKVADT